MFTIVESIMNKSINKLTIMNSFIPEQKQKMKDSLNINTIQLYQKNDTVQALKIKGSTSPFRGVRNYKKLKEFNMQISSISPSKTRISQKIVNMLSTNKVLPALDRSQKAKRSLNQAVKQVCQQMVYKHKPKRSDNKTSIRKNNDEFLIKYSNQCPQCICFDFRQQQFIQQEISCSPKRSKRSSHASQQLTSFRKMINKKENQKDVEDEYQYNLQLSNCTSDNNAERYKKQFPIISTVLHKRQVSTVQRYFSLEETQITPAKKMLNVLKLTDKNFIKLGKHNFSPGLNPMFIRNIETDNSKIQSVLLKNETPDNQNLAHEQKSLVQNLQQKNSKPSAARVRKSKTMTLPKLKTQNSEPEKSPKKKQRPVILASTINLKGIRTENYVIMEKESQRLILGQKHKKPLQIASLTKIMTFYVVIKIAEMESLSLKSEKIMVDQDIQGFSGTSADLYYGEVYTVEQMLYGLMLPSGNDAAICLARWGGAKLKGKNKKQKLKLFIIQMNRIAKQIGLENTNFCNPHGLPHSQSKSTVEDVAKLCIVCLNHCYFRQVVKCHKFKMKVQNIKSKRKYEKIWQNTNKLLRRENFIGIKTGITVTAGPCLASAYIFKGKTYIVVLARTNKISRRFKQTRYLLGISLKKLYQGELDEDDQKILRELMKDKEIDSDYSQEERQFNFNDSSQQQYKKRISIIAHET